MAGEAAEVKPRVSGLVTEILCRAGTPLEAGDLLVADGLSGLAAGMEVVTVPVEYDADGVERDSTPVSGVPTSGADSTPAAE